MALNQPLGGKHGLKPDGFTDFRNPNGNGLILSWSRANATANLVVVCTPYLAKDAAQNEAGTIYIRGIYKGAEFDDSVAYANVAVTKNITGSTVAPGLDGEVRLIVRCEYDNGDVWDHEIQGDIQSGTDTFNGTDYYTAPA